MLYAKGKPGALVVVHQDDLDAVADELSVAPDKPREPSPWLQDPVPFHPKDDGVRE